MSDRRVPPVAQCGYSTILAKRSRSLAPGRGSTSSNLADQVRYLIASGFRQLRYVSLDFKTLPVLTTKLMDAL